MERNLSLKIGGRVYHRDNSGSGNLTSLRQGYSQNGTTNEVAKLQKREPSPWRKPLEKSSENMRFRSLLESKSRGITTMRRLKSFDNNRKDDQKLHSVL